jgi:hypothetical protein
VIIKPTDDAVYKNFVDILDEMAITKSEQYGVTDLKPWEKAIYEKKLVILELLQHRLQSNLNHKIVNLWQMKMYTILILL